MEKLIRTFICIEFPENVVKEIARVQGLLKKKKFAGKTAELENLHLTLKFLGEINEEKLAKVRERLMEIKFKEMNLKLGRIGIFSHHRNPRIVWIKIEGRQIWDLQESIDNSLENLFKKEERFMSHLTIARVKYVENKEDFVDYIANICVKDTEFKVNRFKLKRSEFRLLGPIYSDIEVYGSGELKSSNL